jgi:hypothetical protein
MAKKFKAKLSAVGSGDVGGYTFQVPNHTLGDLENKVKNGNSDLVEAIEVEEAARKARLLAEGKLNDAQRALDSRVNNLRNLAHRDSYWKR